AFGQKDAEPGSRPRTAPAVPGLVDQLTVRELEILRLLAAGAPNQAIAEQLVVTLDTVKKHVSHLLGKLGAANRTEAVHPGTTARPAPLADTHEPRRDRAGRGRGGTVVPGHWLRKIPPTCAPSGDADRG